MRPTMETAAFVVPLLDPGAPVSVACMSGFGDPYIVRADAEFAVEGTGIVVLDLTETLGAVGERALANFEWVFEVGGYLRYLGFADDRETLVRVAAVRTDPRAASSVLHAMRIMFATAYSDDAFPAVEYRIAAQTARINLAGVHLDPEGIAEFSLKVAARREVEQAQFVAAYPRFDVSNLEHDERVEDYVSATWGEQPAAYERLDVQCFLAARNRLRQLRQALKRAARYRTLAGSQARGILRWNGSHTGRFSARSASSGVNVQALRKATGELPELGLERRILVPPSGSLFRSADLSSIEARIVAWLIDDEELLARFRDGEDVYAWFGSQIVPGVVVAKGGPNDHLRRLGKTCILGLCFGMGWHAFLERALKEAPECSVEQVRLAFEVYAAKFPGVRRLQDRLRHAVENALVGYPYDLGHALVHLDDDGVSQLPGLEIELPTGRSLRYRGIVTNGSPLAPRGVRGIWYAPSYSFRGRSTRPEAASAVRFHDGIWRIRLAPHLLLENIAQAIARDVMVHQGLALEELGFPVAFHVHDDLVIHCDDCGCERHSAGCSWTRAGEELKRIMSAVPTTLRHLQGLPLACELDDAVGRTYR